MPPEEEQEIQTPRSKMKKITHYTKFCVLIFVGILSIFVVPGYYFVKTMSTSADDFNNLTHASADNLPWYMSKGKIGHNSPKHGPLDNNTLNLWSEEIEVDRLKYQLTFVPPKTPKKIKVIAMFSKMFKVHTDPNPFSVCPVKLCRISYKIKEAENADAVLISDDQTILPSFKRDPSQIWILSILKNPFHALKLSSFSGLINWTATYRSDSDIVVPFSIWLYYDERVKEFPNLKKNFAAKKTKKAAWFVANCKHDHNGRKGYVNELMNHIDVDVFGNCKDHSCPCENEEDCFRFLTQYKFYLAFENVNCIDYITEKFFVILEHDILPIVMGARPQDYARVGPKNSYIHVDDFSSPKELADYLHKLDQNDDLYNAYFKWKGTGEVIDSKFLCRLCAVLHSDYPIKRYFQVREWWSRQSCLNKSWSWRASAESYGSF